MCVALEYIAFTVYYKNDDVESFGTRDKMASLVTLLALGSMDEKMLKRLKCLFRATNDICKITNHKYYITYESNNTNGFFSFPRIRLQNAICAMLLRHQFEQHFWVKCLTLFQTWH